MEETKTMDFGKVVPQKGVDYFTNADKEEFLEEVSEEINVPQNTSDLANDSGFITSSVNNLVNYYLKQETYTKSEVNDLIGAIQQFHYERVQELPETGESNIMYLVPKTTSEENNYYDEYVYSNGWEKIGDTQIDLSGYVTTNALNQALGNYTTTENLTTLLNDKQDLITSDNKLSSDLVDDTNSTNKFVTEEDISNWNEKQDTLQFDETPTQNSTNPVTSNGIFEALQNAGGGDVENYLGKVSDHASNSTAIDLNQLKKNVIYFADKFFLPNSNLSIKATYNNDTYYSSIGSFGSNETRDFLYLVIEKDIPEIVDTDTTIGCCWFRSSTGSYYKSYIRLSPTYISMGMSDTFDGWEVNLKWAQTITGEKTFNTLPKSSVEPTLDEHFTNKKYVDDLVGDISTVLSTLTTVEEGE